MIIGKLKNNNEIKMLKTGKIKIYDKERGFGFIVAEDEHIDIFFHISDMPHKHILPRNDETVTFEIIDYDDKQKAVNIKRLNVFPNQLSREKIKKLNSKNRNGYVLFFRRITDFDFNCCELFQKSDDTRL